LDGPPKVNDKMRVYSNNLGSSKASIGAIRLLNKESIPFGISCTLTPYNTPILSDVASYFIEELKCKRICFNLPITSDIFRLDPYYATLKMIEAYEVIKKSGGTEDRMSRIIRPLINGGFKLYDCAGCGGQIVVTPDAKIGPCQAFLSKKEGHFEDFGLTRKNPKEVAYKILNSELFNRWAQKAAILNKACKYCKFVSLCGGGCPAFVEQNKLQKDVRWCTYVRNATNWILKELAKDSKTEPAKKFEGDINYRPLNPF
jgi:radical SAM protein with 4Fe4S-binding SPASM domain